MTFYKHKNSYCDGGHFYIGDKLNLQCFFLKPIRKTYINLIYNETILLLRAYRISAVVLFVPVLLIRLFLRF